MTTPDTASGTSPAPAPTSSEVAGAGWACCHCGTTGLTGDGDTCPYCHGTGHTH